MVNVFLTNDRLTEILVEQRQDVEKQLLGTERSVLPRLVELLENPMVVVVSGLRRSGKSTLLRQLIHKKLHQNYYYINFDDERLVSFKAEHFSALEEALISEFGEKKYYIFDEIQNVDRWELFVRRLHNQGKKVLITGSNASLLSIEFGTRLTGRYVALNLFPFSLFEYLRYHQISTSKPRNTKEKAEFTRWLKRYLKEGGIPLSLEYPKIPVTKQLYQDILQRDVIRRFGVVSERELKEFTLNLVSNTASLVSLNKLKQVIKVGNVSTLTNYLNYLTQSWLLGVVNRYSYSVKTQLIAPKKVYVSDPGFVHQVGFSFSTNLGKLLETVAYWDLIRNGQTVYYYKTTNGYEVDFYLPETKRLLQVTTEIDPLTLERENRALAEAKQELGGKVFTQIVTLENYRDFTPK